MTSLGFKMGVLCTFTTIFVQICVNVVAKRFVKICPVDFFLRHLFSFRWRPLAAAPRSCQTHLSERKKVLEV